MGKISRLPAYNCFFFRSGHCIHQEILNPGFDPEVQCVVLTSMEKKFDHLLTQADIFNLSSEQVNKIWASRFGEVVSWDMFCSIYQPQSIEDDRCASLFGNACIMLLPECHGICSIYAVGSPKKNIEK